MSYVGRLSSSTFSIEGCEVARGGRVLLVVQADGGRDDGARPRRLLRLRLPPRPLQDAVQAHVEEQAGA